MNFKSNKDKYKLKEGMVLKGVDLTGSTPLQITVEMHTTCNCKCPDCVVRLRDDSLNVNSIKRVLKEAKANGVICYALTGGEPLLNLDKFKEIVEYGAEIGLDLVKVNTNGYWGNTSMLYEAFSIFDVAVKANKYFAPLIQISLGEQTTPIKDICNILNYFDLHYTGEDDLRVGILNTRTPDMLKYSKLEVCKCEYILTYGTNIPYRKMFLGESIYTDYSYENEGVLGSCINSLLSECVNHFEVSHDNYISPKIFVRSDGKCYPCEIFNPHDAMCVGSIHDSDVSEIIANMNTNKYIKFIKEHSLEGFKEILSENELQIKIDNVCGACRKCVEICEKRGLL